MDDSNHMAAMDNSASTSLKSKSSFSRSRYARLLSIMSAGRGENRQGAKSTISSGEEEEKQSSTDQSCSVLRGNSSSDLDMCPKEIPLPHSSGSSIQSLNISVKSGMTNTQESEGDDFLFQSNHNSPSNDGQPTPVFNQFHPEPMKSATKSLSQVAQQDTPIEVNCNSVSFNITEESIQESTRLNERHGSERSTSNDVSFVRAMEQLNTFYLRVKACSYTHSLLPYQTKEMEILSKLEIHANQLRRAASPSELMEKLSSFTRILQGDIDLSSCFLTNFLSYVQSVIDLENDLTSLSEILECLVPCFNTVLKCGVQDQTVNTIHNQNLLQNIYNSIVATFKHEARYTSKSIQALLKFQCGDETNRETSTKAHIVRMTPQNSQATFQDTFSDEGSHLDMYLIYVWQVFRVYEVKDQENPEQPLVHSLMESIEGTGKYLSIVRAKELQARERSDPFASQSRGNSSGQKLRDDAAQSPHPIPEANFEWADFRLGRVHSNGVAFLVNSAAWVSQLKEISADIEKLEVKRTMKSVPSLGSTYGLKLEDAISILDSQRSGRHVNLDLTYIRVRVVRTAGPIVRVYGVDTGTVHTCSAPHLLILLPPRLIQLPPCGRLARLPVVPCPASSLMACPLALLVSLCQCPDLAQNLCAVDVSPTASWLQVQELVQLTLHLLEALVDALPSSHLLPQVSLITADYLLRGSGEVSHQPSCMSMAVDILTTAMTTSPKIRLMLSKEGIFTTLCELGLNAGDSQQAWKSLQALLGGSAQVEKWAALTHRAENVHHNRHHHASKPYLATSPSLLPNTGNHNSSPGILHLATLAAPDRNWDLEIRRTLTCRQMSPYRGSHGWQWDKVEVVVSDVGRLHYGHLLNVRSDQTHHLILDKSVPNIRMNTLLQIILGMVNSGLGGKVYMGLSQAGVVHGVRITRDQRDCFMLGFSKLVTSEITPSLLPCDSLIQMVPIQRPNTLTPLAPSSSVLPHHTTDTDYFVIVLTVRPQPGLVYRCRDDPVPVVVRGEGGATTTLRGPLLTCTLAHAQDSAHLLQGKVAIEKENLLRIILAEE